MDPCDNVYEICKNKGNDCFKAKNYEKAIQHYSDAIASDNNQPVAYSNRSMCYINLKKYYQAKEDCDKAISLDPTFVKAYYRRATALKGLSRFQPALDDLEMVAKLDTTFLLAKKEIESIKLALKEDKRIDLVVPEKPEEYRSKKSLKKIELRNKSTGSHYYN